MDLPVLTTARLELRPATAADAASLLAFDARCAAVPEAVRFLLHPLETRLEETRARLTRNEGPFTKERTVLSWLVRLRGEDAVVGYAAFVRWDHENHKSEIAYAIDPALWGRGLAVEALAPILAHGWERLGLHRAEARIDPDNRASVRVAVKLGFALEGTLREDVCSGGAYFDTAVYARLKPA
jgi:ribosomal-protein-alanine N-acetyltransferase